jgi:hypothetical protein
MSTTIITKNGSGAPSSAALSVGELAVDLTNKQLYTKNSSGVIKLGGSGDAGQWEQNGNDIYYNDGNVGIGTDDPGHMLSVIASKDSQRSRAHFEDHNGVNVDVGVWGGSAKISAVNTNLQLRTFTAQPITFRTNEGIGASDAMTIDSDGRVGIGGEPGTRTIDEAKALAKTKLTEWKAEVKKRTAEQPEASTQEITLEVTDGDFGVMPTEQVLAEKLMSRAIGGGNAKLQVDGVGYFSDNVIAKGIYSAEANCGGILLTGNDTLGPFIVPISNTGTLTDGELSLGRTGSATYRFKDAYFSGNVTAGNYNAGTFRGVAFYNPAAGKNGIRFSNNGQMRPTDNAGLATDGVLDIGGESNRFKDAYFSGDVSCATINGGAPFSTRHLIDTLETLRSATKDETTVEGLRDAIGNAVGGLIEKFESMQAEVVTQEIPE